jgi:hypothetical protein
LRQRNNKFDDLCLCDVQQHIESDITSMTDEFQQEYKIVQPSHMNIEAYLGMVQPITTTRCLR